MGGLGAVEFADDLGGEVLRIHVLGKELPAQERPAGFLVGDRLAAGNGAQTGLGVLVAVPARLAAHDTQGVPAGLGIEGDGEILIRLEILVGVTVGTDIDRGHALAPQAAHAAPGDGHGVVVLHRTGRHQGPLPAEFVECIDHQVFHVHSSFLHPE